MISSPSTNFTFCMAFISTWRSAGASSLKRRFSPSTFVRKLSHAFVFLFTGGFQLFIRMCLNVRSSTCHATTSPSAVTVAARGWWNISASSPKATPRDAFMTEPLPFTVMSHVPAPIT